MFLRCSPGRRIKSGSASRQRRKKIKPSRDQCLLLGARPAFDLPLGGDRIHDAIEVIGIDQDDRSARRCVAAEITRLMLGEADLEVRSRRADIV